MLTKKVNVLTCRTRCWTELSPPTANPLRIFLFKIYETRVNWNMGEFANSSIRSRFFLLTPSLTAWMGELKEDVKKTLGSWTMNEMKCCLPTSSGRMYGSPSRDHRKSVILRLSPSLQGLYIIHTLWFCPALQGGLYNSHSEVLPCTSGVNIIHTLRFCPALQGLYIIQSSEVFHLTSCALYK